ncbi:MAG: P-loop NTPase [Oligoflexia bacterium]|nr:P-loop NTPase [Oligoflexia bacterium]
MEGSVITTRPDPHIEAPEASQANTKTTASPASGQLSASDSPYAHFSGDDSDKNFFGQLTVPSNGRLKQIWAVGGGKGGVGKSLIASSIAISLARTGNRVVAIDMDLGGSNLHTALGVDLPKQTLSDFITGRVTNVNQCAQPTGIPQLDLISGAQDSIAAAQLSDAGKKKLLEAVSGLNADYLIFDLGAGTSYTTIDFFLYSDIGLIVLLPEPTSIENAYRFIKTAYYRRLWHAPSLRDARHLIEMAMDPRNSENLKSPSDLYREVNNLSPELGLRLKQEIEKFRPQLIVNQARTQADIDIGFSVKAVCKKYFGIEMDYMGYLDYDSAVWQAVRRKRPLFIEFPNSRLVSSVDRIVQYLLKRHANQKSGFRG